METTKDHKSALGTERAKLPNGQLMCPSCSSGLIHQVECRTVWRDAFEKKEARQHISSLNSQGEKQKAGSRCLRDREARGESDSIEIDFECESCGIRETLVIAHHKGATYVSWDRDMAKRATVFAASKSQEYLVPIEQIRGDKVVRRWTERVEAMSPEHALDIATSSALGKLYEGAPSEQIQKMFTIRTDTLNVIVYSGALNVYPPFKVESERKGE